ncbi:MAG: type II toxin-antitoxin system HicB family antitoxin [Bacteroidota bacterium]|nr:type II toxin-antitoxin system HicB family antitoxin [Bacteroidota bacterium]
MKNKAIIVIEKTKDGYSSYAENVEGIYGGGDTVAEAKQSVVDAIRLLKEHNTNKNIPALLKKKYDLVFKFDVESLLHYYKGIFNAPAFEKLTGINQKQIHHYARGKKPREAQKQKIQQSYYKQYQ